MPLQTSTTNEFSSVAGRSGLTLSDAQSRDHCGFLGGPPLSYALIDTVYEQTAPAGPGRSGLLPGDMDYPLGGWYVCPNRTGPRYGSLDGTRIAVEEDIAVAGRDHRQTLRRSEITEICQAVERIVGGP